MQITKAVFSQILTMHWIDITILIGHPHYVLERA